jgi:parvulin-like peptidyl-prolyl isomerase
MILAVHPTARRVAGALLLSAAGVLAGCGDGDIVARAGKTKVTALEYEAFAARLGGSLAEDRDAALRAVGERALLAEAARRADVDDDPAVQARLAATRREILAAVYLDRALESSVREDVLKKRYDVQRETLARRRVHVAHVVARIGGAAPGDRATAHALIGRAYARVSRGEPFEQVARELSQDPGTAARGGDLGPLLEGQVDSGFFEVVAKLRAGEMTKPFESPYGVHLVKALEDVQVVTPKFEEVRGRLAAEARAEAEAQLLANLRSEVGLTLHPERLPGRARAGGPREGEGR